jgi:protein SCO1/2
VKKAGWRSRATALGLAGALLLAGRAPAADKGEHDHCAAAGKPSPFRRSTAEYALPEVTLRDQTGRPVSVRDLEGSSQPLAVNFIFTTCTTICPVMTATFAQMRRELGPEADRIRLVSISIDPEHDSPAVLSGYAKRFEAPPTWSFLTGDPKDVERVLRAFDAWPGSKTSHRPITLLHRQGENSWVRLEGLGGGAALADEVRAVLN